MTTSDPVTPESVQTSELALPFIQEIAALYWTKIESLIGLTPMFPMNGGGGSLMVQWLRLGLVILRDAYTLTSVCVCPIPMQCVGESSVSKATDSIPKPRGWKRGRGLQERPNSELVRSFFERKAPTLFAIW